MYRLISNSAYLHINEMIPPIPSKAKKQTKVGTLNPGNKHCLRPPAQWRTTARPVDVVFVFIEKEQVKMVKGQVRASQVSEAYMHCARTRKASTSYISGTRAKSYGLRSVA
jgi:hypothetical protein